MLNNYAVIWCALLALLLVFFVCVYCVRTYAERAPKWESLSLRADAVREAEARRQSHK